MRIRLLAAVLLAALFGLLSAGPLSAHTEVWQRSPEQGAVYGGTLDEIQISFFSAVESSRIDVIDPNGDAVEVSETTLESQDRIAVAEFAALTEPGAYVVTHSELADDGDIQTAAFQFFFDPDSPNVASSLVLGEDSGTNWILLGIISGVVLILAGIFWPSRTAK